MANGIPCFLCKQRVRINFGFLYPICGACAEWVHQHPHGLKNGMGYVYFDRYLMVMLGLSQQDPFCFLDALRRPVSATSLVPTATSSLWLPQPFLDIKLQELAEARTVLSELVQGPQRSCTSLLVTDGSEPMPEHVCDPVCWHLVDAALFSFGLPSGTPFPLGTHVIAGKRFESPVRLQEEGGAWALLAVRRETAAAHLTLFGRVDNWANQPIYPLQHSEPRPLDADEYLDAYDQQYRAPRFGRPCLWVEGDATELRPLEDQWLRWYRDTVQGAKLPTRGRPAGVHTPSAFSSQEYVDAVLRIGDPNASDERIALEMFPDSDDHPSRSTVQRHRSELRDVPQPEEILRAARKLPK